MRNLIFALFALVMLAGCKVRQVGLHKSDKQSTVDSTVHANADLKTGAYQLTNIVDTGRYQSSTKFTISADFKPDTSFNLETSADENTALLAYLQRYLKSFNITMDKQEQGRNGYNQQQQTTTVKDSSGSTSAQLKKEVKKVSKDKTTQTKPDYSWIIWMAALIACLFLVLFIYQRVTRPKFPVL
jgi:apolipoprotein N-acyltransferase